MKSNLLNDIYETRYVERIVYFEYFVKKSFYHEGQETLMCVDDYSREKVHIFYERVICIKYSD